MSRYIDADALHDALKAKQKWVVRCGDKHNEGYTYDQVHFAIDDAPSIDIPIWIPCSERMPEETEWIGTKNFGTTISDKVLVTFESKGERFVKLIHFQNGELGGLDKQTMDTFYGEWKAVAWMPLPEPWEGVEDE